MPKVRWDGDASNLLREQEKATQAAQKYAEELRNGARSAKQLEAAATKIKEAIDPQTKLNRLYAELGQHVKAGRLTIEQATAAGVKFRQELGLTAAQAKKTGSETENAFGAKAAKAIGSYLTGLVSVGGALAEIRSQFQAIQRENERAAQTKLTVAQAEEGLRRVVATDPQRAQVLAASQKVAEQRNLPLAGVFGAFTSAYGASSDAALTIATITAAAEKTRDTSKLAETAAGIGFILQSSRIKDAREAGGLLDQVLAISPIVDEKVPQALSKVVGTFVSPIAGGSEATAGTLLGLLSQASADVEGDRSRTGAIQFVGKSQEFFEKNRRRFGLAADAIDTVDERLKILFEDKNLGIAQKFIKETTFEAPVAGGFATLFLDPSYRARFRAGTEQLGSRDARLQAAQQTAEFIQGGALQQNARVGAVVDSLNETLDVILPSDFTEEQREKLFTRTRQAAGLSRGYFRRGLFALATGPTLSPGEAITEIENALAAQSTRFSGAEGGFGGFASRHPDDPQVELRRVLEQQLNELRTLTNGQRARITTRPPGEN